MTIPDVETTVQTWLVAKAPSSAPPTLLDRVRTRRGEVVQRRWLAYLPVPRMPTIATFLPSATSIAAIAVVVVTASVGVFVAGRSSDRGLIPSAGGMPGTPPGFTIEFAIIEDGVMSAQPGADGRGAGTFTMSGSLVDRGTFTEIVSATVQGEYHIERTLLGSRGTMVAVATATTWIEGDFATSVSGTWYLADGGRAYPGVVAEGTMTGIYGRQPHETWIGEVRR